MPREGHPAGRQVSPFKEEAPQVSPQARALGESTLGWAGHAQLGCTRPAQLPPHLLQPLALGTLGWQRPVPKRAHKGAKGQRAASPSLTPGPSRASCSRTPRFSSARACLLLQSLGLRGLPAKLGGSPRGGGSQPWHTPAPAVGKRCVSSGGCHQFSTCDGGSQQHPGAAQWGAAMPACPRTHGGASGRW